MDRQEYREIISEIRNSYKKRDYERVIMFAQELPVRKIKENNVLEMLATAYDEVGKTSLARTTLELAYRRMPNGKQTAYKMAVLSLKLDDIESAVQYYEEFCKIAPNDNQKYILKYQIATEGGLSLYDRIRILEEYREKETDDRWMYELARLYHEAGMGDKCAEMCDEIVIWFSDGEYLKKALELKFAHKALSPTQQAMYERIMQEYIEDYEEPEPEPPKTYEEYEEDAEQFANDYLGVDPSANPADGDTKPIGLPKQEEPEDTFIAEGSAEAEEKFGSEEKRNIAVTTTKGEPADDLAAEVASSIAINGVSAEPKRRKNIFYDFKLELSEPLRPIHKPEPKEEPKEESKEELKKETEAVPENKAAEPAPEPVKEQISEEAEQISEILFAGEEKVPALTPEPDKMTYVPEEETVTLIPSPEEEFEKKTLRVNEGQVGLNLDLLHGEEKEIEGQLSIDQLFKTYASNIEYNADNKAAVAQVEAERLRQIREAVENSMPAVMIDDFDEEPLTEEAAFTPVPERAVQVRVEEDTVAFSKDSIVTPKEEPAESASKDTVVFNKEDLDEGLGELTVKEPEEVKAENLPAEGEFHIEDEPELAYEDPVDKLFREFEEQERAKELARKEEIEAMQRAPQTKKKEIEIPAFLRDIKFSEPEEDDLEEDLRLLEEEEAAQAAEELAEEAEEEEIAEEVMKEEDQPSDITEDDLFDEIMAEVEEEASAAKPVKTEEEIAEELDDLGDFLAESMGKEIIEEPEAEIAETAEPTEPTEPQDVEDPSDKLLEEMLEEIQEKAFGEPHKETAQEVKKLELTEEQEEELDDLGDVLADLFGDEEELTAEEAEEAPVEVIVEETAEEKIVEEETAEEETVEEPAEDISAEEEIVEDETVEEETVEEEPAEAVEEAEEIVEEEIVEEEIVEEEIVEEETVEEETVEEEPAEVVEEAEEIVAEESSEEETAEEETAEEEIAEETAEEETVEEEPAEVPEEAEEAEEEELDLEALIDEASEEVEAEAATAEAETGEEAAEEIEKAEGEIEETVEEDLDLEALIEEASEEAESEPVETVTAEAETGEQDEDDLEIEMIDESLLGDTQPIERIRVFTMPREMREELAEFLLIDGMDTAITETINNIILTKRSGDPTGGHLIITGDKKIGKTFLTISIIKAINNELNAGTGKVAKVQSDSLNGKDVAKVFHKIAGNDLIIENVGDLEERTIRDILNVMKTDESVNNMVVFEGNMLAVETIINNHPEMKELFKNRVDVSELTISQWADVACDYAKRKGYRVGDMALLALHAKIDEINIPTTRFGYEDIVNIMETAIEKCEKRNTGKLFSAFSKKEGEEIELNESDFI